MPLRNSWPVVLLENWQRAGFGIYVHWPFCEAKCPYCDFNSHVVRHIDHTAWTEAYLLGIDRWADRLGRRTVSSIFFGGGTPSLMRPETVDAIIGRIASRFPLSNTLEITLEANPSSVEAEKFSAFAKAGVNRVSLGVQAINDIDLKVLGRLHTASDALAAVEIARDQFDRVSFDIIYARQNQSLADWDDELTRILQLGMDHLSLYQLTIEDGTAFGDRFAVGKLKGLPNDDLGADLFALTQERCAAAGMRAYEVSNHAQPGQESRHNLIYWRGGDYLGIGPGAHGRVSLSHERLSTVSEGNPQIWLSQARTGTGWKEEVLSALEIGKERLLMGLRLDEPLHIDEIHRETGMRFSIDRIQDLSTHGFVEAQDGTITITPKGRPLLNTLLAEIVTD